MGPKMKLPPGGQFVPQKQAMTRMVNKGLSTKGQLAAITSIQRVCLMTL